MAAEFANVIQLAVWTIIAMNIRANVIVDQVLVVSLVIDVLKTITVTQFMDAKVKN